MNTLSCILVLLFYVNIAIGQISENIHLIGRWAHGPCFEVSVTENYVYKSNNSLLQILNITVPEDPVLEREIIFESPVKNIYLRDNKAYIIDKNNILHIFNISNPANPLEEGSYQSDINIGPFVVQGNYAYLGNSDDGLRVLDVSNPGNINEMGSLPDLQVSDLEIQGGNLLVAGGVKFSIVDVSNPSNPFESAFLNVDAYLIAAKANYVYVTSYQTLQVISISDLANPVQVGTTSYSGTAYDICSADNYVFVADRYYDNGTHNVIRAIYIANPSSPVEALAYDITENVSDLHADNGLLFVAAQNAGLYILSAIEFTELWNSDVENECAVTVEGNYAYLAERGGPGSLRIFNVSDPSNPVETGSCNFEQYASDWMKGVTVNDQFAYVVYGQEGMHIIDISNPLAPIEVGMFRDWSDCMDVVVEGNYAYIVGTDHDTFEKGLLIVDITDPTTPVLQASAGRESSQGIELKEGYAYVVGNYGLFIFDVSNPLNPVQVSYDDQISLGTDIVLVENYAYIGSDGGLFIYDITDPYNPNQIGHYDFGPIRSLEAKGNIAYIPYGDGQIHLFDISDPANPVEFDNLRMTFPYYAISSMVLMRNYLYCAGINDFRIFQTLDMQEIVNHPSADNSRDVTTSGDIAYIANERNGLYLIDISDPSSPQKIGHLDTPDIARNVEKDGNYACVADQSAGLRVINISDPSTPFETGFIDTFAYNVEIEGNRAYLAGEEGMHIIDLSNPSAPSEIGFFNAYGMVSDAVVIDNLAYLSGGSSNNYFVIVDVSNPGNPVEINRHLTYGGNLVVDKGYAYIAAGYRGLKILNVSNPENIIEVRNYPDRIQDIAINGDYACVIKQSEGLRIWDISNPAAAVEEGFYTIGDYLSSVSLNDGQIYVTDGYNGLYVLQEEIPPGIPSNLTAGGSSPSPWQNSGDFEINWINPGDLSGISQARYKVGTSPTSNSDYDGTLDGAPPYYVEISEEGSHLLYLWLIDGAGNELFINNNKVYLRYDNSVMAPTNFTESHQLTNNTWQNSINNSTIAWAEPSDLTGIDIYYIYYGSDPDGSSIIDSTLSTTYTMDIFEGISFFRVQPKDSLGNLGDWTTGFVYKYDQTRPFGTVAFVEDSSAGNFVVSWSGGEDGTGSGLKGHYDVKYKDGNGNWTDWLIDYKGNNAVFSMGEVGHIYYFEAAARDSADNIENFSQQAECSTFVTSNLGFSIQDIKDEQTEFVEISYTITNSDSVATDIRCEYSLGSNDSWHLATVQGQTTNIMPDNYQSQIIWDSYTDTPGIDLETVKFKITPSDINGIGLADSTAPFHLDNNRIPNIVVDPLEGEQNGNCIIFYHLWDIENDMLDIHCDYFHSGSQIWLEASISGQSQDLSDYDGQIEWHSATDLPEALGYYLFRIRPEDNDPGISDTVMIYVDNVGAPDVLSISEFAEEQSGDITIHFILYDEQSDNIDLTCEYSQDAGVNWSEASVSGNTTNISSTGYSDSLIWQSENDLPGIDNNMVQFRITASDGHSGLPLETSSFHLDNNYPPTIQIGTIISPQSGIIEIPININDSENDTIQIIGKYKLETGAWQWMQLDSLPRFSDTDYNSSFFWNSLIELNFGEYNQVQVQLTPTDNDSGPPISSNAIEIYNYAGDYNGDIQINSGDLLPFAIAWHQQDVTKEIGPASGQPPLLMPQPDGVINFEDLMVLVQQWNWSYEFQDHMVKQMDSNADFSNAMNQSMTRIAKNQQIELFHKELKQFPKSDERLSSIRSHLVYMEQSEFDQWSNQYADEFILSLDTTAALLGFQIEIDYDPRVFTFSEIKSMLFIEQDGIIFKTDDRKNGRFILNAVVLESKKILSEIRGKLINFKIDVIQEESIPLKFSWKIFNEHGVIITQGQSDIHVETQLAIPRAYSLYQNFPNPFNPSTTIRYQLPVGGNVQLSLFNILGEKVQSFVDKYQQAGYYSYFWDISQSGFQLASGIYFVQLLVNEEDGGRFIDHKKLIFLK